MALSELMKVLDDATTRVIKAKAIVQEALRAKAEAERLHAETLSKAEQALQSAVAEAQEAQANVNTYVNQTIGVPGTGRVR